MTYAKAFEKSDIKKIDVLNTLTNIESFYDDLRKITKKITSDHSIRAWERLSDLRYAELLTGIEDVKIDIEYDEKSHKFKTIYY